MSQNEDTKTIIDSKFKKALNELYSIDKTRPIPPNIKSDTFRKYLNGERFPSNQNLEIIANYYNVTYGYLLGDYDNQNLETSKISANLGVSGKNIDMLQKIILQDTALDRNIKLFAINQILSNVDFLELGKAMLYPSENNQYILTNELYKNYSKLLESPYYQNIKKDIQQIKDMNDFKINKMFFNLCDNVRNSNECIDIFKQYVKEKEQEKIDLLASNNIEHNDEYYNKLNSMNLSNAEDTVKIQNDKFIQDRKKELEEDK